MQNLPQQAIIEVPLPLSTIDAWEENNSQTPRPLFQVKGINQLPS